uniref:Ig-like domain-containing protein n=1 Tax=Sparus aurata TaxID=8175 RepID=A0A671W9Y4_SPAAU
MERGAFAFADDNTCHLSFCFFLPTAEVSNVVITPNTTDLSEPGCSVSLSCSASGSYLSFLWLNSSSEVTASDRVQLTDGGSILSIINVTRYDQGPFICHVFNNFSNYTSDPVELSISFSGVVVASNNTHLFEFSSSVSLSCSSSGSSLSFLWMNGSSEVTQSDRIQLTDGGATLTIINVTRYDQGPFRCNVSNGVTGEISLPVYLFIQSLTLNVLTVPITGATIRSPAAILIEDKSSTNLSCEASGSIGTRDWMKDGRPLHPGGTVSFSLDNRIIFLQPVQSSNHGTYQCRVSNPVILTWLISFLCAVGPHNISIDGPSAAAPGGRVMLRCTADSVPPANFSWTFNGNETHVNTSLYVIERLDEDSIGNYTCTASNMMTMWENSTVLNLRVLIQHVPVDHWIPGLVFSVPAHR